jgi:mannosyltransferase OCH1-like enzyme
MIPKIIHYCWFGNGEMPEQDKQNIEMWKILCPDYEIKRWDESNYDINKCLYMKQAYEEKKMGFVPDFARLDIIYNYGGFYFDTDVELIKNLDILLNEHAVMGFESTDKINHGHGFGAEPHNELIKELMEVYDRLSFRNNDGSLNLTPSPTYITDFLKAKGVNLNNTEQYVEGVHILPTEYFCPKNMYSGNVDLTKNTISIHHFNMSWGDDEKLRQIQKVKKLSKFFGVSVSYNMVEFSDNFKNYGMKKAANIIFNKVKKRIRNI